MSANNVTLDSNAWISHPVLCRFKATHYYLLLYSFKNNNKAPDCLCKIHQLRKPKLSDDKKNNLRLTNWRIAFVGLPTSSKHYAAIFVLFFGEHGCQIARQCVLSQPQKALQTFFFLFFCCVCAWLVYKRKASVKKRDNCDVTEMVCSE